MSFELAEGSVVPGAVAGCLKFPDRVVFSTLCGTAVSLFARALSLALSLPLFVSRFCLLSLLSSLFSRSRSLSVSLSVSRSHPCSWLYGCVLCFRPDCFLCQHQPSDCYSTKCTNCEVLYKSIGNHTWCLPQYTHPKLYEEQKPPSRGTCGSNNLPSTLGYPHTSYTHTHTTHALTHNITWADRHIYDLACY